MKRLTTAIILTLSLLCNVTFAQDSVHHSGQASKHSGHSSHAQSEQQRRGGCGARSMPAGDGYARRQTITPLCPPTAGALRSGRCATPLTVRSPVATRWCPHEPLHKAAGQLLASAPQHAAPGSSCHGFPRRQKCMATASTERPAKGRLQGGLRPLGPLSCFGKRG